MWSTALLCLLKLLHDGIIDIYIGGAIVAVVICDLTDEDWDKWVVKKKGDWGYELRSGAPEYVVKEFEEYQAALRFAAALNED